MFIENQTQRQALLLLCSRATQPVKSFAACTLGSMASQAGMLFDAYYSSNQEGEIFSVYGSSLIGGRHDYVMARALYTFDVTVAKLGEMAAFDALFTRGARAVREAPDASLVSLYADCFARCGVVLPTLAVFCQTYGLPAALAGGVEAYAAPEAFYRRALYLPLETNWKDLEGLVALGVRDAVVIAAEDTDVSLLKKAGLRVVQELSIRPEDTYHTYTLRILERWKVSCSEIDVCPPVNAAYRLPAAMLENRLIVYGEYRDEMMRALLPTLVAKGQRAVYGRYGGEGQKPFRNHPLGSDTGDVALFPLYDNNIAFQVTEPGRPVMVTFSKEPVRLAQPDTRPEAGEPDDDTLRAWAEAGRILVSLVYYSGELSHTDGMLNAVALSSVTGVKAGISVHWQRYLYDPHGMELLNVPVEDGGVLGLCEPLLHAAGHGIQSEARFEPKAVAHRMREAREIIASCTGEAFAPTGVNCYLDACPGRWHEKPLALWEAMADEGFSYAISTVGTGENAILYRKGDFVVLNQWQQNVYPSSPFVRVGKLEHLTHMERELAGHSRPGWILGTIDSPVYVTTSLLLQGRTHPSCGNPSYVEERIGKMYEYIRHEGDSTKLISATPRVIARYALVLEEMGLLKGW